MTESKQIVCVCRIDEILIPSQVTHISVTMATTMKSITHTIVMFLVHVQDCALHLHKYTWVYYGKNVACSIQQIDFAINQ